MSKKIKMATYARSSTNKQEHSINDQNKALSKYVAYSGDSGRSFRTIATPRSRPSRHASERSDAGPLTMYSPG